LNRDSPDAKKATTSWQSPFFWLMQNLVGAKLASDFDIAYIDIVGKPRGYDQIR